MNNEVDQSYTCIPGASGSQSLNMLPRQTVKSSTDVPKRKRGGNPMSTDETQKLFNIIVAKKQQGKCGGLTIFKDIAEDDYFKAKGRSPWSLWQHCKTTIQKRRLEEICGLEIAQTFSQYNPDNLNITQLKQKEKTALSRRILEDIIANEDKVSLNSISFWKEIYEKEGHTFVKNAEGLRTFFRKHALPNAHKLLSEKEKQKFDNNLVEFKRRKLFQGEPETAEESAGIDSASTSESNYACELFEAIYEIHNQKERKQPCAACNTIRILTVFEKTVKLEIKDKRRSSCFKLTN